ncbi:MAG: FkbM family methyltransferase [Bacteroidetes bacterium]|nr:FkbM family methyltransferase [Bacteroidota bacterium]
MAWSQLDTLLDGRSLIVVDAGARNGFTLMPQLHAYMNMYAFEPDTQSVDTLRKQYASAPFRNSAVFDIALSDKTGKAQFHQALHPSMSSLLRSAPENMRRYTGRMKDSAKWVKSMERVAEAEVQAETLDNFAASANISYIDFLKLDTQGSELRILHGAAGLLQRKQVGIVFTEVMFVPVYEGQPCFTDIDLWMRNCGYMLVDLRIYTDVHDSLNRITAGRVSESPRIGTGGDAVYIPANDESVIQPLSTAIMLAALGYFSLSEHMLHTHTPLSTAETETLFRIMSKQPFRARVKRVLKRFTPPVFHYWYSRITQ